MPIKILMPALSPTMTEGNLVRWHKKEGDSILAGDLLAEIETDKATMEVEAVDEGTLGQILVASGTENVAVNSLIGWILEEGETVEQIKDEFRAEKTPVSSMPSEPLAKENDLVLKSPAAAEEDENSIGQNRSLSERIIASPLARRLASQGNINLKDIEGTGPRGRIIKSDVEKAQRNHKLHSVSASIQQHPVDLFPPYEEVKLTSMRKVIAQRLQESKQNIPHFYLTIDCEIDNLLKARQDVNKILPERSKLSVNDFIIKAVAMALKKVPTANAAWGENHIKMYQHADVAIAVAIEGGLVTPIIRQANLKSLQEIGDEAKELIVKARAGKLLPHEFQGGTFSISNLGMFGIREFSAVINPPQACILAVGSGEQRAVVKEGVLVIRTVMTCTLSADHRVVDGAVAAEFLKVLQSFITDPVMMLA